jgi:SAM-dependent methyltransferase
MPFGDKWRKQNASYWEDMAARCEGLPFTAVLAQGVRDCRSIIEIGCGAGHLAAEFRAAGFAGSYWGCDISQAAVDAARVRLGPDCRLEVGQFEHLAEELGRVPMADVAVARSVIQHQPHWLPLVDAALGYAPRVLLGVSRDIYFKETGEHEPRSRGTFYDVKISLEALEREASEAGLSCHLTRMQGPRGPEVVIELQVR